MSGWISKAANVFKPNVPEAPQPFVLFCSCGEEHRGFRKHHSQQVTCAVCGTKLFILPRDVYPAPHPASKSKKKNRKRSAGADFPVAEARDDDTTNVVEVSEADIIDDLPESTVDRVDKESSPDLPTLEELRERAREGSRPRDPRPVEVSPTPEPNAAVVFAAGAKTAIHNTWKSCLQFWTPFRCIVAVVLLVMVFTAAWMVHQSLLSRAAAIAVRESELGLQAIEDENWPLAREHLSLAADALNRLGRTDPEAQTVRQYARETEALFLLSDATLEEIIADARNEFESQDEKNRSNRNLARKHHGSWLVLEGEFEDVTADDSPHPEFALKLPAAGNTPDKVIVQADFDVLRELIPDGGRKNVILAGAIQDCEYAPKERHWIVRLAPDTGFLWTHENTWRGLGFQTESTRSEDDVQAQLGSQAQAMGVPP